MGFICLEVASWEGRQAICKLPFAAPVEAKADKKRLTNPTPV